MPYSASRQAGVIVELQSGLILPSATGDQCNCELGRTSGLVKVVVGCAVLTCPMSSDGKENDNVRTICRLEEVWVKVVYSASSSSFA